jgi:hypothetical protein
MGCSPSVFRNGVGTEVAPDACKFLKKTQWSPETLQYSNEIQQLRQPLMTDSHRERPNGGIYDPMTDLCRATDQKVAGCGAHTAPHPAPQAHERERGTAGESR